MWYESLADVAPAARTMGERRRQFQSGCSRGRAGLHARASGVLTTGGKKAFAVAVGGNASDFVFVDITVVDSQTGNILFFTYTGSRGNFVEDTGRMGKPIEKSFKDFSCSAPSDKLK